MTKRAFWHVRRTKTQISLRICAVRSESSLSAWRNLASLAIQNAPSEDSDQTARMRRLIWIFAGRTCPVVRFLPLRILCLYLLHFVDFLNCVYYSKLEKYVSFCGQLHFSTLKKWSIIGQLKIKENWCPFRGRQLSVVFCLPSEKGSTLKVKRKEFAPKPLIRGLL